MEAVIDGVEILPLVQHEDERGWLAEILRAGGGVPVPFGQILVTVARPGVTKGGHYHTRKVEWFCVIQGTASLVLEDLGTGERQQIEMGEHRLLTVKIPPRVDHYITNTGTTTMVLLVYANEPFDPHDADTFVRPAS